MLLEGSDEFSGVGAVCISYLLGSRLKNGQFLYIVLILSSPTN